jgi:hypothetical protein
MVGPTAQLVAIACHFNGRARGLSAEPFFPSNSTCKFCEYVHFVRRSRNWFGKSQTWITVAPSPDEWLTQNAKFEGSAFIVHQQVDDPRIADRISAGFIGGGGRWLLITRSNGSLNIWEAKWEVGNREAPDQRIWRVSYGLIAEGANFQLPSLRSLEELKLELHGRLSDVLAFAEQHQMEGFANCFRKAIGCLSATDPFELVFHKDLAPAALLDTAAKQVLAACQAAWVFGGMGSWNDMSFDGAEQARYERISQVLFLLLNESICVSTNSAAVSKV